MVSAIATVSNQALWEWSLLQKIWSKPPAPRYKKISQNLFLGLWVPSRKIYKDTSCRRIALIILNIKYLKFTHHHSPHSLVSAKDMHVEMLSWECCCLRCQQKGQKTPTCRQLLATCWPRHVAHMVKNDVGKRGCRRHAADILATCRRHIADISVSIH